MLHSLSDGVAPVGHVGGKAASLMKLHSTPGLAAHVPGGFALSVHFFAGWADAVVSSPAWAAAEPKLCSPEAPSLCAGLKEIAQGLPLSPEQESALQSIREAMAAWPGGLAAVRSSCPEEDGAGTSFAGVFETKLGVTAGDLEEMVRECFASVFDHRVFSYAGAHRPAFAAVVMEMVDSYTAGVAFSANPLNSDLDEMLVDSSWGLGESVVDGSVVADRFLYDKVRKTVVERTVGTKKQERRLEEDGGVETLPVDAERQAACTLTDAQVAQLAELVGLVEATYGVPMDTEWAHTEGGQLRLLQARPITAIHPLDKGMLTAPGERRVLYYDWNVASEATTTSPFTPMDIALFSRLVLECAGLRGMTIPRDPSKISFAGETRYYFNLSYVMKYVGPSRFADAVETLDPYLASIFRSDDCDRERYRARRLPPELSCCSILSFARNFPIRDMMRRKNKYASDPKRAMEEYLQIKQTSESRLEELEQRGAAQGIQRYFEETWNAIEQEMRDLMGVFSVTLPVFDKLSKARLSGATQQEKDDAEAMLGGFDGDELMEINIAMHNLAHRLPADVWKEYAGRRPALAARIAANLRGEAADLPADFLEGWRSFLARFGWDGGNQLFASARRYRDSPEILLARLQQSAGDNMPDPAATQRDKVALRRKTSKRQEDAASSSCFPCFSFRARKVRKRNAVPEHLMYTRNSMKLRMSRLIGANRAQMLRMEEELLAAGRLDERGDVFMLNPEELDRGMQEPSLDLRALLAPRKANYQRALNAKSCPMLIDSRCRILRPNIAKGEPGILVGTAISPGKASGRVRILSSPDEDLEEGEVLVTVVTDPSWTPLFVGVAAVVLQVGGALQHGGLVAREYGKPAVSGIDVNKELRTGMLVEVDGSTGVVRILEKDSQRRPSRLLESKDLPSL